jgi:hypothetical protein
LGRISRGGQPKWTIFGLGVGIIDIFMASFTSGERQSATSSTYYIPSLGTGARSGRTGNQPCSDILVSRDSCVSASSGYGTNGHFDRGAGLAVDAVQQFYPEDKLTVQGAGIGAILTTITSACLNGSVSIACGIR